MTCTEFTEITLTTVKLVIIKFLNYALNKVVKMCRRDLWLISFVTCVSFCLSQEYLPCDTQLTVDITNGDKIGESDIVFSGVTYSISNYYTLDDRSIRGCICNVLQCVFKCCPFGEWMHNKTSCEPTHNDFTDELYNYVNSHLALQTLHIIHKPIDCFSDDRFRFIINVGARGIRSVVVDNLEGFEDDRNKFCVDYFFDEQIYAGLLCVESQGGLELHITGMIISMPFLLTTFLVYALLPDRNLPAKALMCYVLSLLFAYIMLVTIQLSGSLEAIACKVIAFLCYFFFMVSFFWMNTSCIDIWLTFSGIKGLTGQRTAERKRFVYYCLYAWGVPLAMVSVVIGLTSLQEETSSELLPGIGAGQCWLKAGLPTGIYFYFPIAILVAFNIALFIITAIKIRRVQRDTKVLNAKDSTKHDHDKQRDDVNSDQICLTETVENRGFEVYDFLDEDNSCFRFNLYLKLLFAMGVNWSMEIISWAVQWKIANIPNYIWYLTDFCNAMYGVFIFFIFVFKRNIWMHLRKRYLQFMGKPTQAHTLGTSTHRTTVSQVTSEA